jgi:hypothetical protein
VTTAVIAVVLGAGTLATAVGACKGESREDAVHLDRDRERLTALVELDLEADRARRNVREAEKAQREDDAARWIEANVLPATDAMIARARAAQPETSWGRARRDELLAAVVARREELSRYATALRAHDAEAELTSVTAQIEIERRAMSAAQAIEAGPDAGPM